MLTEWQRDLWLIFGVVLAFLQVLVGTVALVASGASETERLRSKSAIRSLVSTLILLVAFICASEFVIVLLGFDFWQKNDTTGLILMKVGVAVQLILCLAIVTRLYLVFRGSAVISVLYGGFSMALLFASFVLRPSLPKPPSVSGIVGGIYLDYIPVPAVGVAFICFLRLSSQLFFRALHHTRGWDNLFSAHNSVSEANDQQNRHGARN